METTKITILIILALYGVLSGSSSSEEKEYYHHSEPSCPAIHPDPNAIIVKSNEKQYYMKCQKGFTQQAHFICTYGMWYTTHITCQRDPVMCTALPDLLSATVPAVDVSNATPGFTVPFTCDMLFTQNGAGGTLTCNNDGNFVPDITCEYCTAFQYTVTPGRGIDVMQFIIGSSATSETECAQLCAATGSCQTSHFVSQNDVCIGIPDSFVGSFVDLTPTAGACQGRCTLNQNCMSYSIFHAADFQICLLSKLRLKNLVMMKPATDNLKGELGDKSNCV